MAASERLDDLAEQKRLLIQQAALHRAVLQTEITNARARLQWVGQVRDRLPGTPWLLAGGAAAGFFAVRKWRTVAKALPVGLAAWRWFKKIRGG